MRKIVAAFDQAGFDLKEIVIKTIRECGFEVIDAGTDSKADVDFTDYAYAGCQKILEKEADKGIFVCGTGIEMCLAANKIKGIYAAAACDCFTAQYAAENANINVLCLGAKVINEETAHELITTFLYTKFSDNTDQIRRLDKIHRIEEGIFELKNASKILYELGQSVWFDTIRRRMIKNGHLARNIENGIVRGVSSNPSVFREAISNSRDYENAMIPMAFADISPEDIYTQLTVEDMRNTADLFRDLYIKSGGNDGFVSLEISPLIAHDTELTIIQAKQLWKAVNRPNLMIKIPVTQESYSAITELTAAGLNLNLTLIFSPDQYKNAANSFIAGLRKRIEQGDSIDKISSVASVFVSRLDSKIDKILLEKGKKAENLLGKAGVKNAQKIFNLSLDIFDKEKIDDILSHGGKPQRVLWASTGIKNKIYKPTYYIESLIGQNTVTTVTQRTLDSMQKLTDFEINLPEEEEIIDKYFEELKEKGIDINNVYAQLESEGISNFSEDYQATLISIQELSNEIREKMFDIRSAIQKTQTQFEHDSIIRRIFSKDPTVWTFDTTAFPEIRNSLGWLDTFKNTEIEFSDYTLLHNELLKENISTILFLSVGGYAVTAEVIANIFEKETDIKLLVLDSTDPEQISSVCDRIDPRHTLFLAAGKSGNSVELTALTNFFYDYAHRVLDENTGNHFAAITLPGSNLEQTAKTLHFRRIFLSDTSVGYRYASLTSFGMIPAVLAGLDPQKIILKVHEIMANCSPSLPVYRNEGCALGNFIGNAAAAGMNKLTIITDPEFKAFGSWIEQLTAGSSGKDRKGIIPVDSEPFPDGKSYTWDRAFVYINYNNHYIDQINTIREKGHPVFEILIDDNYDIFAEFYRWEIAISAACAITGVNAFDEPNVTDGKKFTSDIIAAYRGNSSLQELPSVWFDDSCEIWANKNTDTYVDCISYHDVIMKFISNAEAGKNYVAVDAFLPKNKETSRWLQNVQNAIFHSTGCATTLGFGPRCLHSTGQLHKGGPDCGYFIQIVADHEDIVPIPDDNLTFNIIERAQALGDLESLAADDLNVIRIRFKKGLPPQE